MFDFANILFSGPCNARCPFCIGRQIDPGLNKPNLDQYPPLNLEGFEEQIHKHHIQQVVFTGSNTDPLMYRHAEHLLQRLKAQLPASTHFSLHTNGRLALRRMHHINQFDRVCVSFPSFEPTTYQRMMGVNPPAMEEILRQAVVPVKVSCVVTEDNQAEIPLFLERCRLLGIRRVVLRKLFGDVCAWGEWLEAGFIGLAPSGSYRGSLVMDYWGMQVTLWDFQSTESNSINLFSDGTLSHSYRLIYASPQGV